MTENIKIPPPCFDFLNGELISAGEGKAECRFTPTEEMENPYGSIQGGILAGMMDNVLGPAMVTLAPDRASATIQMSVNYLKPAKAGEAVIGRAEVVRQGTNQVYLEGSLERESDGTLLLRATATNIFLK
jgi:uncharacterized protein (TIGR00369 family)